MAARESSALQPHDPQDPPRPHSWLSTKPPWGVQHWGKCEPMGTGLGLGWGLCQTLVLEGIMGRSHSWAPPSHPTSPPDTQQGTSSSPLFSKSNQIKSLQLSVTGLINTKNKPCKLQRTILARAEHKSLRDVGGRDADPALALKQRRRQRWHRTAREQRGRPRG